MKKVMMCPCGEPIRGDNEDEFVDNVNQHLSSEHPEMAGHYTREQILSRAMSG